MKLAILKNGEIVDAIIGDLKTPAPEGCEIRQWRDGDALIQVEPVPESVTKCQLRLLLNSMGLFLTVDSMINGAGESQEEINAKIYWNDAGTYMRSHPMVQGMGAALKMTDEQIDQAFIQASKLA